MNDLNMFRALQQSRQIVEEESTPKEPIRLASEVISTTSKHQSAITTLRARIKTQAKPKQWNVG